MAFLHLKRLSIDELNTLANEIIDELSTRNTEECTDDFTEEICKVYTEEDKLNNELNELELDKKFIEEEIAIIKDSLERLENKESELLYQYEVNEFK